MAKIFKLDKIISANTEYTTPKRVAYVIRKIGTNSSGTGYLEIENVKTGEIDSEVAPLHKTSSNLLGPLDLEDLFYVIPPETNFKFVGDAGSKARIIGDAVFLDVGEGLGAEFMGRFVEQGRKYITVYSGNFSLAVDEVWSAGDENEVFSITPLTIERVKFDSIMMVKITGGAVSEGDFGVKFYMNNIPFELDVPSGMQEGIDSLVMPYPPADTTEEVPFTLKDFPIEVLGDYTFSIRVKNTSGADKTPTAGSAWTVTVKMLGKYERVE